MSRKLSDRAGVCTLVKVTGWKINLTKSGAGRRGTVVFYNDSRFPIIFFRPAAGGFRERTGISRLSLVPRRSRCQTARSRFSTPGSIYKCRTDKHTFVERRLASARLSSGEQCNAPSTIKFYNSISRGPRRTVGQIAAARRQPKASPIVARRNLSLVYRNR